MRLRFTFFFKGIKKVNMIRFISDYFFPSKTSVGPSGPSGPSAAGPLCFDMKRMLPNKFSVCIGKRHTGKSWLIRDIILHSSAPTKIAYSSTEDVCPFYTDFLPKDRVKSNLDDLENVLDENQQSSKNGLLIAIDSFDGVCDNKMLKRISLNQRCNNVTLVVSLQYPKSIPLFLREDTDYVFLFNDNANDLKKCWECYAGMIPTFDEFKSLFYECTKEKYSCMVIDKVNQQVFYYKARGGCT